MKVQRINGLDVFRGLAILAMILYHFTYDLNYFRIISVDMNHSLNFLIPRYIIMSMFLVSVGMSLALAHSTSLKWLGIRKRILLLGLAAIVVSISTYVMFPNSWVYFGILHFILLASLIVLPFLKFPKITLILTLFILLGSATQLLNMHSLYEVLKTPLSLPLHSEDLVPLFPWLAVVFIGTLMVYYDLHVRIFNHKVFSSHSLVHKVLKKMGQHSLIIYLIHQPILFIGFELYIKFFSK